MKRYRARGLLVPIIGWTVVVALVGCAPRMEAAGGNDGQADAATGLWMVDAGSMDVARSSDVATGPHDAVRVDGSTKDRASPGLGGMPKCMPGQFLVCEDFEGGAIDSTRWTVGHAGYNGWSGDGVATIEAP